MTWKDLGPGAEACLSALTGAGCAAYPVGGCVRDLLLGRARGDVDICTSARPEEVMALFPRAVPTGIAHGTVTVPTGDGNIEITTFRREGGYADSRHPDAVSFDVGLREDLSRRDFTVNAMALGPGGEVIDPFGGREDLKKGLIRCVGDPDRRFAEDALRMFRAVRFAAQLGFQLEEKTAQALERNAFWAEKLSRERIRSEMEKILLSPRPEMAVQLFQNGLLNHLYTPLFDPKLDVLSAVPATREDRWRAFCKASGFPISLLPVERKLRRAVEHPEAAVIPTLALKPRDLQALGLKGSEISAAQKKLALHVLAHPTHNTKEALLSLLTDP